MTIETINVGLAANDGTGDDLREAMIKINNNFTELDIRANQTGANLGSAGTEVYKNSDTNTLYFRRLLAGTYISLVQNENSIVVNNSMPLSSYAISTMHTVNGTPAFSARVSQSSAFRVLNRSVSLVLKCKTHSGRVESAARSSSPSAAHCVTPAAVTNQSIKRGATGAKCT